MSKVAIIIYGPPGSGKGTQAEKIAEKFNLVHFDTGKTIEKTVHDPKNADDPIIQKERQLFDTGKLCTPSWVLSLVGENIKKIFSEGKGIVFSGSPRTLYETEGDKEKKIPGVIEILEKYYGKENIIILRLNVSKKTAIYRNTHRRVCEECGFILQYSPENEKLTQCPKCGGKLVRRSLDTAEVMKVRLKEYEQRTKPIYDFLEKRGYKITEIDGEPSPEIVTKNIFNKIGEQCQG